jgi:hypothetical protein
MKIVINDCFGGFGLSYKACILYAKLCGFNLFAYEYGRDKNGTLDFDKQVPVNNPETKSLFFHYYKEAPVDFTDEEYKRTHWNDSDIPRSDANLVRVVEELGDEASGDCAELKVVEIPDGVDWQIDEYDGTESIHEKHRSWG